MEWEPFDETAKEDMRKELRQIGSFGIHRVEGRTLTLITVTGLRKFVDKYVVEESVPIPKLIDVFGYSLVWRYRPILIAVNASV